MKTNEIIDKAIAFYENGGKPGVDESGNCVYEDSDTEGRCAIGCLVEDPALLQREAAELSVYTVNTLYARGSKKVKEQIDKILPEDLEGLNEKLGFLTGLQRCHDYSVSKDATGFPVAFKEALKIFQS